MGSFWYLLWNSSNCFVIRSNVVLVTVSGGWPLQTFGDGPGTFSFRSHKEKKSSKHKIHFQRSSFWSPSPNKRRRRAGPSDKGIELRIPIKTLIKLTLLPCL